jgi:hypothetical protein
MREGDGGERREDCAKAGDEEERFEDAREAVPVPLNP